jgi:hypothetical protein
MREVAGSTPGLDFYLLCEPICVSLRLQYFIVTLHYTSGQATSIYLTIPYSHAKRLGKCRSSSRLG